MKLKTTKINPFTLNDSKSSWLRLGDLQYFADGGEGGAGGEGSGAGEGDGQGQGESGKGEGTGKVEFTPEQQEAVNKIIGEKLGKAQTKWEEDYKAKLEAAKTEAEKLAKMNADQKAEYESKKRLEELEKREKNISTRELKAQAYETLAEKGLPKELADILVYTDADSTNKSIESVEKVFRSAVEKGVNERLKGDPPKGNGGGGNAEFDAIKNIFSQR